MTPHRFLAPSDRKSLQAMTWSHQGMSLAYEDKIMPCFLWTLPPKTCGEVAFRHADAGPSRLPPWLEKLASGFRHNSLVASVSTLRPKSLRAPRALRSASRLPPISPRLCWPPYDPRPALEPSRAPKRDTRRAFCGQTLPYQHPHQGSWPTGGRAESWHLGFISQQLLLRHCGVSSCVNTSDQNH